MDSVSEKEKFIRIIKDHKRILYQIIHSYCSNPEDRKDLEQEIIIQLWKSLKYYNNDCQLSTWVYRIALNVSISYHRKDSKRKANSLPLDNAFFLVAKDDTTDDLVDSRTKVLHKFISQLDEFNRAIMILYLEENTYKEIAEILGISETNVGTKINRIKSKLKDYFSLINN